MGTQVLRPQDCLIRDSSAAFCHRRSHYYNPNSRNGSCYPNPNPRNGYHHGGHSANPKPNRKPAVRSDQKKRFGAGSGHGHQETLSVSKRSAFDDSRAGKGGLVMEKVTILRRGESLDSKIKNAGSLTDGGLTVISTERLGPGPDMVPKQTRIADPKTPETVYAGSAVSVSPEPSSLPLPSFSKKKTINVDDSATRDLRRLLRLEF